MNTSAQEMNETDIISSLPESIICHILSRLPSKEAVRSSVLSKDWKYKWMSAYNVDIIDCEPFKPRSRKWIFKDFMDKLLYLQHDLKSFRLLYHRKYTNKCLMEWISAAFSRKVESFELQRLGGNCFVLPISLLNNITSLKTLKLACTNMNVSCYNSFLHLTDLYLEEVEILSEAENSNRLAFTFPVLKTFELYACIWPNVKLVEIYSPALRTLKCDKPFRFSSYCEVEGNEHVIKICDAKLENFECGGYSPENISLHNSTVHRAALRGCPQNHSVEYGLKAGKLMEGLSNLYKLELSSYMCQALAQSKQALRLPKFDNLLELEMYIGGYAELLLEFLHSAPALKFLKLDRWVEILDFVEEDLVPYCVTSSLKEVVFINCCSDPIIDLARFFLKHGLELKKVYIHDDNSERDEVVQLLKTCPKASADAEILPPGSFLN